MPPPSSPVPRLSSVPSDVFTVHTIASRSPLRPIVSAIREKDGRPPRPILGDAIATTSPHLASEQQPQGIASTFCHPSRLVLFLVLVLFLQVVRAGQPARAGDPLQLTPSALSILPGCVRIYADTSRWERRYAKHTRAVVGTARYSKFSGKTTRLYRSKYQLFIFSEGFGRTKPVHRGNGNCT